MAVPIIDNLDGVPEVASVPVYYTHHALLAGGGITDGNGNRFRAAQFNFSRSNTSRVYVQKIAPNGVTLLGHWQVALANNWKHDDFGLDYSGNDLIVWAVGHDTPNPVPDEGRLSPLSEARIVGVFENPGALEGTRGGASVSPAPQEGEPVDYEQIREIMRYEVERGNGRLADEFDPNGIAAGLRSRPGEGLAWFLDDANYAEDETARKLQDTLFQFVKNANAGVQANILGGQDDWGVARRNELKQIIREVLQEIDTDEEAQ